MKILLPALLVILFVACSGPAKEANVVLYAVDPDSLMMRTSIVFRDDKTYTVTQKRKGKHEYHGTYEQRGYTTFILHGKQSEPFSYSHLEKEQEFIYTPTDTIIKEALYQRDNDNKSPKYLVHFVVVKNNLP